MPGGQANPTVLPAPSWSHINHILQYGNGAPNRFFGVSGLAAMMQIAARPTATPAITRLIRGKPRMIQTVPTHFPKVFSCLNMKKLNLYGGAVLFVIFLYTGYLLSHVAATHAANSPIRISTRSSHIYLLFAVLLNLLAYRVDFRGRHKFFEPLARSGLLLSGACAAIGFFMQKASDGTSHNLISPAAVMLSFLSVALFLLDGLGRKK